MTKRLIVLLDITYDPDSLLKLVKDWSSLSGAEVLIVNKIAAMAPALTPTKVRHEIVKAEIDQTLICLRQLVEQTLGDYPVKYRVLDSNLLVALPEILEEGYDDIVIAGLKSTSILKKLLIGSAISEIVDYVHIIVVAVPFMSRMVLPDKLNVAISPAYPLNVNSFGKVLQFFGGQLKHINFFSVLEVDADRMSTEVYLSDLATSYREQYNVSVELFKDAPSFARVRKSLESRAGEMLVLQRGGRSTWDVLFRKSRINDFIYEGSIPFIVLP